jgi:RNA polymerase sigma-70 factor, ECF subfamily
MSSPERPPSSFADVYAEFEPKIRRYLARLSGTSEAEDLTQEVFARVGEALPRFRGDSTVSTWVYRIATNAALDRARSRSSHAMARERIEQAVLEPDASSDIEARVARSQTNECIRRCVDRLPPRYRAVLLLSGAEELTNQEIAEALAITVDTVKIRLHRARRRLRKELGDGCEIYRDERNELGCEPRAALLSLGRFVASDHSERGAAAT